MTDHDHHEPAGEPTIAADAARLLWLEGVPDSADVAEVLGFALPHAVASVGGLGGLAHLVGREAGSLRLAGASGIPTSMAKEWELLHGSMTDLAPTRAMALRQAVWSTTLPSVSSGLGKSAGVLSVPIVIGGDPVGTLSVLAQAPPTEAGRRFLGELTALVSVRLQKARRWRSGTAPWWQLPLGGQMMRNVEVGTWAWDLNSGELNFDTPTEDLVRLAGLEPGSWDQRIETWMGRIHPDDRRGVEEAIAQAMSDGTAYAVEYRVVDRGGRASWLELRAVFEYDADKRPLRMVGTAWNVTARRSREAWLAGILDSYPQPIYVLAPDDRTEWANLAARSLAAEKGREILGRTLWDSAPQWREQGLPEAVARARTAPGSAAGLTVESWENDRGPHGGTASYQLQVVGIGDYVSVVMTDITESVRAAKKTAERGRRVAQLNAALIRALETSDVVAAITEHFLPLVGADGLLIYDLTGPAARLVGATGYSSEFVRKLRAIDWPQSGFSAAEQIEFVTSREELRQRWPQLAHLGSPHGNHVWAVMPLVSGARRVGSCVISWNHPRDFSAEDKSLIGTVAAFTAQSLGNARLYEEARARAERLQQELLPSSLPNLVAVQAAARWRAAAGQDVGGDWYDTIPLPGGRTLAVVGDVMGHGLEQSITMGIIRHTIITMAALDLPLDELMARVGDVVARLGAPAPATGAYATCLMVLYDPTTGTCSVASAGHAPPIVLQPDDEPRSLALITGPPLGVAHTVDPIPVQVTETTLAPGSIMILFTNGVLGSAETVQLTTAVSDYVNRTPVSGTENQSGWLSGLCAAIIEDLPPDPRHQDDAALLALRTGRVPAGDVAVLEMPCAPQSAGRARSFTAAQLLDWNLEELIDSATLIVSELVGNTTRHAVGIDADVAGSDSGEIRLRWLRLDDGLLCEVYDGSEATPRVRHPTLDDEFGRGLQLVALTATNWGARYIEHGKCIWAYLAHPKTSAGIGSSPW